MALNIGLRIEKRMGARTINLDIYTALPTTTTTATISFTTKPPPNRHQTGT